MREEPLFTKSWGEELEHYRQWDIRLDEELKTGKIKKRQYNESKAMARHGIWRCQDRIKRDKTRAGRRAEVAVEISNYLATGMNHMTPEGRHAIAEIIANHVRKC